MRKSEQGLKDCAKLFTSVVGDIDEQTLRNGYRPNLSFRWLLESGSIEAHYEMQTFLPHDIFSNRLDDELRAMQSEFVAHAEASMGTEAPMTQIDESQMPDA